jgi:hypothetical protein
MEWLIAIALLVVLAPLLMFALASMKRGPHSGGGGAFIALDQVFDPSKRHLLEIGEERVLERDKGEPPLPPPQSASTSSPDSTRVRP